MSTATISPLKRTFIHSQGGRVVVIDIERRRGGDVGKDVFQHCGHGRGADTLSTQTRREPHPLELGATETDRADVGLEDHFAVLDDDISMTAFDQS